MNIHFQESPILGTMPHIHNINYNWMWSICENFFALMAHDRSTIQTMWHINAVSLWHHQYTYIVYVHVQKQTPRNSVAIKGMWKQCVPGALSPPPPPCLGTRLNLNTCCEAQITCYYKLCHLQSYMPSFLCGRSSVRTTKWTSICTSFDNRSIFMVTWFSAFQLQFQKVVTRTCFHIRFFHRSILPSRAHTHLVAQCMKIWCVDPHVCSR